MERVADLADRLVEWAGLPLALLAWVVVSSACVGLALVLRRYGWRQVWPALLIGAAVAAIGHGSDIAVTLWISPDLGLEANEMWNSIVRVLGLKVGIAYGLTGQMFVIVLSGELYAWYRIVRARWWPADAATFLAFARDYGRAAPRYYGVAPGPLLTLGAFMFVFIGPFFLYIAALNTQVLDEARHAALPQPIPAVLVWLAVLVAAFYAANWRDYRRASARARLLSGLSGFR